jgi:signal transduction histidine kinase
MLIEFAAIVIVTLMLISLFLTVWMNRAIVHPILKLNEETRNIKEGNLDTPLPVNDGRDEISNLTRDFEEMRVILKDSAEEKVRTEAEEKELIRNISHDLKTPLTAIKGYVEGLMDGVADTPEKRQKYLRTIYNKANDMDRLIDELTMYSKIDMNKVPYTFRRININSYMTDCCEEIGVDLESRGIGLEFHNYSDGGQYVMIDCEQMKRVINNIVNNSVKYMADRKGVMKIEIFDDGENVLIRLEDNGKGIAAEDLKHIFERFYRADSARGTKEGGSGIGLAIVKKIVEDHGGTIWAESTEGIGTVMNIRLKKVD